MSIIKVENLTKVFKKQLHRNFLKALILPKYENFIAVDSISFEIKKSETFGLLGPNGAGKTTTIKLLCGLEYPTTGNIFIDGLDLKTNFNIICGRFNVLFSDKLLYNRLSAFDNLVFYGNLYSIENPEERAEQLIELVGLMPWKDQYIESFSLGMRMKLALARALINDPEIVYLDEPTLGLDVKNAEFVRDFLKKLDRTILLTTHYLNEAIMLCDRIGILQNGKLIHFDTPENLKKQRASQRSFLIDTNDNQAVRKILKANPMVENIIEKNMKLEIFIRNCDDYFKVLNDIQGFKLYQFQELKTGLEELFFDTEDELKDKNN